MKKLYSVFDSINNEFAQPFMLNNDTSAIDMFTKDIKNIARQNLAKFQEPDIKRYKLYLLCDFDNETGYIYSSSSDKYVNIVPTLIYDVEKDFDFTEFEDQLTENDKTRGLELQGGING